MQASPNTAKFSDRATKFYIMLIDGRCTSIIADDKVDAFIKASAHFAMDFDDFLDDVNLCEWKDEENRILEAYNGQRYQTERFPINSSYQLEEYENLIK